ncbi:MAG TPA: radical SAM protein [Clostridiales bacterium]|nr:MAG: hypothetical protein A2Y22_07680 [Clostridiales bacterium GWD2_32_59]HAN09187.1 radical SAM protein [Clostridiales bacterium]
MKSKRFKRIYIEITNICNMRCSFCPPTKRESKFMSIEDFEHVLKEVKPFSDYICLHIKGEPLMHPRIGEILDLCDNYDLKANLTTNGTLLKEKVDILVGKKALRQINISLHSFENDSEDDFIKYFNNILYAIKKVRSSSDTIISFRMWNQGSHSQHKVMDKVYFNFDEKFEWPDITRDIISETGFCHGLRDQIGILVDGTVVPCCLDNEGDINLGNIFKLEFSKILESDHTNSIIKGFRENKLTEALCKRCGYASRFR